MAVEVLAVCTGNVCRSPMVERLLAARLGGSGVRVSSAGTRALVGEPMTEQTAALVARAGGDPRGHVARLLSEPLLAGSDLVLTATRAHRSAVVQMRPALLRRTFTVREAGRLATHLAPELVGSDPQERLADLVPRLAGGRGRWPVTDPGLDDVDDPYGRDDAAYARTAAQVEPAVAAVLAALTAEG